MAKWNGLKLRSALLSLAALATMGAGVAGTQFRQVNIVVQSPSGKQHRSVWTFGNNIGNILHQAGVHVAPHDTVSPSGTQDNARPITVHRAIPVVVRTAHDNQTVWTTQYRVSAVLRAAHVHLGPLDEVQPALNASVTSATHINVIRRRWVTKQIKEKIPFKVKHRPDKKMAKGKSKVQQKGRDGLKIKTVRELIQDSQVVRTKTVGTKVVKKPRPTIIEYGTAHPVSRGGPVLDFTQAIPMVATAYWPNPAWSNGLTATGVKAHYGIVAVDPRVIPLGTHLYIPGYGFAVAEDTGGAIKGDRIDLCYNDAKQTIDWGVRHVTVYVLKN